MPHNSIEIIPAIMPESFKDLQEKAEMVRGLVETVQIDVMDGVFVPSKDWPYIKDGVFDLHKLASGSKKLPFADELRYEIDFMIMHPEGAIEEWARAGVGRIIVHVEASENIGLVLERLRSLKDRFSKFEIGLAINTETSNEALEPYISKIDFVQFMGIEKIGYQSQPFDERVISKIKDFRKKHPDVIISVDGGVNFDTAPRLIEAGANRLVSGSAIFGAKDIKQAIEKLKE